MHGAHQGPHHGFVMSDMGSHHGSDVSHTLFNRQISLGETVAVKSKELYHDIVKR